MKNLRQCCCHPSKRRIRQRASERFFSLASFAHSSIPKSPETRFPWSFGIASPRKHPRSQSVSTLSHVPTRQSPRNLPKPRFFSLGNTDDRTKDHTGKDDAWLLEKAAVAANQHVERGVVQSLETALWKTSDSSNRKKLGRFFVPRWIAAAQGLLAVTSDVDSLRRSIRERKGKLSSLNELHRAFLNLTQLFLDHLEQEDNVNALKLVLALSNRAQDLSLAYHWPLYHRLAMVVAKHPCPEESSRAEWIQRIHQWSRITWGSEQDNNLQWFHPILRVLAKDGKWSDVWELLISVYTDGSDSKQQVSYLERVTHSKDGHNNYYYNNEFEDDEVVLLSPTLSMEQELVFDLLMFLEDQGRLKELWDQKGSSKTSEQTCDILLMMEPSIWKTFRRNHPGLSGDYSLRDAIESLLQRKPTSPHPRDMEEDFFWDDDDDDDKDSLTRALLELEDLLDEHMIANDEEAPKDQNVSTLRKEIHVKKLGDDHHLEVTDKAMDGLDFIYDHRASDYRDHIPDIASQIYDANGNKELLYDPFFESHICHELQGRFGYDDSDDDL